MIPVLPYFCPQSKIRREFRIFYNISKGRGAYFDDKNI